jgi:hypothetical protein
MNHPSPDADAIGHHGICPKPKTIKSKSIMRTKETPVVSNEKDRLLQKIAIAVGVAAAASTAHASTDYGPAIWKPANSGTYQTTGNGHKFHVVHDIEGYYATVLSILNSKGASVHYAVNGKKDNSSDAAPGEISQFVRDAHYAYHARCWNLHSTGTEHEGFASNPAWFTPELYNASAGVTRNLANKFGYAKDRNHIIAHGQKTVSGWPAYASANLGIDPYCNTHTDPGPYWDWTGYMTLVNGALPVTPFDFDGDGWAEKTIFRPSDGGWYRHGYGVVGWGTAGDIPVPADYNNDRVTDIAIYRPSAGTWHININGWAAFSWGLSTDIPVPADYNGDKKADIAVFRPSAGTWHINIDGWPAYSWGYSTDIPVPADYDGDGWAEIAVFRPSDGGWYRRGYATFFWGQNGDIPVPADYNGDGKVDIAVFRPSSGTWHININGWPAIAWGQSGDIPAPADYNGDRKADIAVFRKNGSFYEWHININGWAAVTWGQTGDIPIPLPYAVRRVFFP